MAGVASVESQLDALHTVIAKLTGASSQQAICDTVIDSVPSVFDVEFCGLWLYDTEKNVLRLTATNDAKVGKRNGIEKSENAPLWDVFKDGTILTGTEIDRAESRPASPFESEIIISVGESGVLKIGSFDPDAFRGRDRQIAEILATNIEAALDKQEQEHELGIKNDRLEEFMGILSHDLKNPLSVADGNIELAQEDHDDDRLRKASGAIDRMDTLIDDLMTLSKQGFVVADRKKVELETLATAAWSNVHTPSATLETAGDMTVYGEKSQLLQVFENLFRNSIEHASDDVTVRVGPLEPFSTSTRESESDNVLGFYVEDDGPGVPENAYTDVFDSGYSSGSTGLGLSIVYRIVVAHGWEITCKDPVQSGARFEVTDGVKAVNPFVTR